MDNKEARRAYEKQWREKNKERCAAASRRWRERHLEKVREKGREAAGRFRQSPRWMSKEWIEKRAKWRKADLDKFRERRCIQRAEYKQRPEVKERENARQRAANATGNSAAQLRRAETRSAINAYKVEHGCCVCGYKKCASAIHFHHDRPGEKEFTLATAVVHKMSFDKILDEMEKCALLCANCHAEVHAGERELPSKRPPSFEKWVQARHKTPGGGRV